MTRDPSFERALEYLWDALAEITRLKKLVGEVQMALEKDIPNGRLHPIFEEIVSAHGLHSASAREADRPKRGETRGSVHEHATRSEAEGDAQ